MIVAQHTETIPGMWTTIGTGTAKEGVLIEVPGRLLKGMTPAGALLARLVCLTAIELHETSLMCAHMNPGRNKHPLETDGMGNMRPQRTHTQTLIGGHTEAGLISSIKQGHRAPTTLAAVMTAQLKWPVLKSPKLEQAVH